MQHQRFRSEQVVRFTGGTPTPLHESTLSTSENALLDLLRRRGDAALTASDVVRLSPLSDAETLKILSRLIAIGVVELSECTSEGIEAGPPGGIAPATLPAKLGRFEVDGALGRGAMGAVLLARDPAIQRVVAIKLIQSAAHLSPSQRDSYHERFYREASAAGQLHHPAIATVFDVGHGDDGTPFIVMEYVKGRTLREVLDEGRPSVEQALHIAADVLDALGYAHAHGIVHRDVKPGNIIITPDFRAKIMDFGIAHVVGSELTTGNDVLGSPYYMAPEQLSKGNIDARTDLFSFAVVLYRMLTGELPFTGESFAAIAHAILQERPRPVERHVPAIDPAIGEAVLRGLAKEPNDRFGSAAEFSRALGLTGAGAVPAAIKRRVASDRWLPVAVALVIAAFFVFRLATLGAPGSESDPVTEAAEASASPMTEPASSADETALAETPLADDLPGEELDVASEAEVEAEVETEAETEARPVSVPSPPAAPAPRAATSTTAAPATAGPRPGPVDPDPPPRAAAVPERQAPAPPPAPPRPEPVEPSPPAAVTVSQPALPSPADLYYEAGKALERGDLDESRRALELLLQVDPSFAGAADLLVEVDDRLWQTGLPLELETRHDHRIGGCEGLLGLDPDGMRFRSNEHEWAWTFEEMRVLEHPDETTLILETHENDPLLLGKKKRFKFLLAAPLAAEDWTRYERLMR